MLNGSIASLSPDHENFEKLLLMYVALVPRGNETLCPKMLGECLQRDRL